MCLCALSARLTVKFCFGSVTGFNEAEEEGGGPESDHRTGSGCSDSPQILQNGAGKPSKEKHS